MVIFRLIWINYLKEKNNRCLNSRILNSRIFFIFLCIYIYIFTLNSWALVQDPDHPEAIYAGTRPAGFFRSTDAGQTWQSLSVQGIQKFSEINVGPTRVTQMLFDPKDHNTLWVVVEIGGVYRSSDCGNSWELKTAGLISNDMHGILIVQDQAGQKIIYTTANCGLHRSIDNGESWEFQALDAPWQYTRSIISRPVR